MPTKHLLIKGKVQGVFYRVNAKEIANRLKITGWIKNTYNGDVEAMISGNNVQLEQFIEWCKQGPSKAVVTQLISTDQDEIMFSDFFIKQK